MKLKTKTKFENQTMYRHYQIYSVSALFYISYGNGNGDSFITFVSHFRWFNSSFYHHLYANIITRICALHSFAISFHILRTKSRVWALIHPFPGYTLLGTRCLFLICHFAVFFFLLFRFIACLID